MSEILAEVTRNNEVESRHRGHIVAVDRKGTEVYRLGDPSTSFCMRSCAKPFQALPVIESGAADRFGLSEEEVAVLSGSLNGQDFQVRALLSILTKTGLEEGHLACGIHRPSHRATAQTLQREGKRPGPLNNNCAGKHVAMLLLCLANGWSLEGYWKIDHPVQELILKTVSEMVDVPREEIRAGIDGCGVPVFFVPLKNCALAYARLSPTGASGVTLPEPRRTSIERLMKAALRHPEMIAGDERLCTNIMRTLGDKVFAKTGAEGGYALTLMERGLGVAIKIEDGSQRALDPVVIETLGQLGLVDDDAKQALEKHRRPIILNHRKERVGAIEPAFTLRKA
jgi:L-asparaginase II